jgi:hypothetical protein
VAFLFLYTNGENEMKDKTFADYCMRHGVKFPADTVVFNLDDLIDYSPYSIGLKKELDNMFSHNEGGGLAGIQVTPIFPNMFFEWRTSPKKDHYIGVLCSWVQDVDNIVLSTFAVSKHKSEGLSNSICLHIPLDNNYRFSDEPSPVETLEGVNEYALLDFINHQNTVIVAAIGLLNMRGECSLKSFTSSEIRGVKKRTGKEPSPYFLLRVHPNKTRKTYPLSSRKHKHKNRQHIVRGHFRHTTNHPIAPFNGTFWIPSHMRGNESIGQVQKGYRIVLPDNEEQTS